MDEVLSTNFFVVQYVVDEGNYDLVVGDEAWEVDSFWLDNPSAKRTTRSTKTNAPSSCYVSTTVRESAARVEDVLLRRRRVRIQMLALQQVVGTWAG
jgi:hypothetical protein